MSLHPSDFYRLGLHDGQQRMVAALRRRDVINGRGRVGRRAVPTEPEAERCALYLELVAADTTPYELPQVVTPELRAVRDAAIGWRQAERQYHAPSGGALGMSVIDALEQLATAVDALTEDGGPC